MYTNYLRVPNYQHKVPTKGGAQMLLGGDPAALQGYNAGQPGAGDPGEDLAALSRPELQARAKAAGVPANLKSVEIIRRLQEQRSSSPGKWADK